jgi:hypothetical protein
MPEIGSAGPDCPEAIAEPVMVRTDGFAGERGLRKQAFAIDQFFA